MTAATVDQKHGEPHRLTSRKGRRWAGGVIGLLIGVAAVCHGCHGGDRDDELSLNGRPARRSQPRARVEAVLAKPLASPACGCGTTPAVVIESEAPRPESALETSPAGLAFSDPSAAGR